MEVVTVLEWILIIILAPIAIVASIILFAFAIGLIKGIVNGFKNLRK